MSSGSTSGGESCNRAQLNFKNSKTDMLRRFASFDFSPVGFGEKLVSCGKLTGSMVCLACWAVLYSLDWCNRRECPVCYVHWARQGARRIAERLSSREAIYKFFGMRLMRGVISPAVEIYPASVVDWSALKSDAIKQLKRHGVLSGVVVFHAYRTTRKLKALSGELGFKHWDTVHELQHRGMTFEGLVLDGWIYFSPHFHWMGFARHTKPGNSGLWVFKVFDGEPLNKSGGKFIPRELVYARVFGHAQYLLSHSSSFDGSGRDASQSYSWFGARYKAEKLRSKRACPVCGGSDLLRWGVMFNKLVNGNTEDIPAGKVRELELAVVEGVMPANPILLDGDV